jgi:hypothetical protein
MSSGFLIARGTPFLSDMIRFQTLLLKLGSNKEFSWGSSMLANNKKLRTLVSSLPPGRIGVKQLGTKSISKRKNFWFRKLRELEPND